MNAEKIPGIWLERYLLDELPSPEREQVSRALILDKRLAARLEELRASGDDLLRRLPPEQIAEQIARGVQQKAPHTARGSILNLAFSPVGVGLLALLLVAGVAVELLWRGQSDQAQEEIVRQKGAGPALLIFRKTADGAEQLAHGGKIARNDVIQLSYQAAGSKYGAILSLDGRGTVTQHFPAQGSQAGELVNGSAVPLASAYRLDDAPKMEVFFFVTSDRPFPVQIVRDAIAGSGPEWGNPGKRLRLPTGFQQSVLYLEKESNR